MARRAPKDHDLLFLDFETGGLSPFTNDFVEVGCVRTDPSGRTVQEEYVAKVFPQKPVDAEAAAINGYTKEKWASEAIQPNVALMKVLAMARDTMMVCHNTPFDKSFLEAGMATYQMRWPGSYHSLDTVSLSMPLLRAGLVPNVKLLTLTTYFRIPHEAHRAIGDVHACRSLYLLLMEIYGPGVQKHAEAWVSGL
jgi:DNA polymerase III alpha subunit (gram-positive type)